MNGDQKLLLISGTGLFLFGAIYIFFSGIPNTATTALLFPISILALFGGIALAAWGAIWILADKFRK